MGCVDRVRLSFVRIPALRRIPVVGSLAIAAACGGESIGRTAAQEPPPQPATVTDGGPATGEGVNAASGTRLTVQPYSPDSPHVRNEKGVACVPKPSADGTERCLPE